MKTTTLDHHLTIDGLIIPVQIDPVHQYTLASAEVAAGYGITPATIRKTLERHADELREGHHWVVTNSHTLGGTQKMTHWTRAGIIRLGFFIRSERAKRFRNMAEALIIRELDQTQSPDLAALTSEVRALREEVALLREQARRNEALLLSAADTTSARLRLEAVDPLRLDVAKLVSFMVEHVGRDVRFPEIVDIAKRMDLFHGKIAPNNRASTCAAVGKAIAKYAGEVFHLPDGRAAILNAWGAFRGRRFYANVLDPTVTQ